MEASEGAAVGVVGGSSLRSAVEAAGAPVTAGDAGAVLSSDPDWVVAEGEAALSDLAAAAADVPVLAVDANPGVPSVDREQASDAVEAVRAGELAMTERRLFDAAVDGERAGTVLWDAMLITGEPARISEYAVRSHGREVARFRADGVVVATPAGSEGYLGSAGGPVVEPGTGVFAAVPVAPFRIDRDHWVLDDRGLSLSVHRDEPVVLVVDGEETRRVPRDAPVELVPAGELALYAAGGDWKNSNGPRTE
jgi:NAD+ kinase